MKKIVFLFSFVLFAGMLSAQTCKKSKKCCASKAKSSTSVQEVGSPTSDVTYAYAEADKLIETDENIEKRVCDKSGAVSYYQKTVCSVSGKESWSEVEYCTKSKAFKEVVVADMKMEDTSAEEAAEGGI